MDCNNVYHKNNPQVSQRSKQKALAKRQAAAQEIYSKWLMASKLPFKPMTEAEWQETCSYFGGCAICGEPYIETRQFIMEFQHGGKYAAWNVFPMCGQCSTVVRVNPNPFMWLDEKHGGARAIGLNAERKQRMLEYFIAKIEEVVL